MTDSQHYQIRLIIGKSLNETVKSVKNIQLFKYNFCQFVVTGPCPVTAESQVNPYRLYRTVFTVPVPCNVFKTKKRHEPFLGESMDTDFTGTY